MQRLTRLLYCTALTMAAGCMLVTAGKAQAASDQRWVYALSWSPEFCGRNLSSKESQCDGDHLLVPQWLSRTVTPGMEQRCQTSTPLPADVVEHMDMVTANRQVAQDRWLREGACLGDPQKYFTRLDYTTRKVAVPSALTTPAGVQKFSSNDFKTLFVRSNPGLPISSLALTCRLSYLESVNICLDGELKFAACSGGESDSCGSNFRLRPNLRQPR